MRFARRQGGSEATANFPGLQLSESIIDLGDTWERLRAQLTIKRPLNKAVLRELNWFRKNQDYLTRMTERARMYLPYILRETESRSLPVELALLPVIESAYQPSRRPQPPRPASGNSFRPLRECSNSKTTGGTTGAAMWSILLVLRSIT